MLDSRLSRLHLGRGAFWALLGIVLALFAVRNLPFHLDDYDQAKQAFVPFDMVKSGHWWLQNTPGGKIATKPPLAGWISAGLWLGTGGLSWDFAWRLPGFAAALWLLALLAREGRRLYGWEGAMLAMAAFGLNLMTPRLATLVRTDMLLTLFIALVGFAIYRKLRDGTPWTARERWGIFAVLLASMLTKGPIVYAFLLPGLVAFWWLRRREISAATAWSGWWCWFGPLLFFALWAGLGLRLSPAFYEQVVQREFLGRFTVGEAAVHHNQPVYYYGLHLLRHFFPWSAVLIALACVRDVRARVRRDPALLWLVCWAVGGFVFMSLVPSKRGDRIFPVLPPLCLLVPALAAMLPAEWLVRGLKLLAPARVAFVVGIALLFSGSYSIYRAVESYALHNRALVDFGARVRSLGAAGRRAVVETKDEGMLLYVDRPGFIEWDDAEKLWQKGALDVLVTPLAHRKFDRAEFPGATVAFTSEPAREKFSRYQCLIRETPAARSPSP